MSEKSDKHGFRLDDQLGRETKGLVRGGGPTRAEQGHDPEPVETDAGRDPTAVGSSRETGTPPGMTSSDVEHQALGDMPERAYTGLPDVLDGLGYGHETSRF